MRNYQLLDFGQKSHRLPLRIYPVTQTFLKEEGYGLTSPMRGASASIPTNIAEDCGREATAELKRFFSMAAGSSAELHHPLRLCKDLHYLSEQLYKELSDEVVKSEK